MKQGVIKILFIGDIVGKPGRRAAKKKIADLKKSENIDYVFANGENLAAGKGITFAKYEEMIDAGVDFFTSGNHVWNNKEIVEHLADPKIKILRPYNYPKSSPGKGFEVFEDLVLANLQGRVFMKDDVEDPFSTGLEIVREHSDKPVIIDIHAEATSEKVALGHFLDGKAAAVLGTHTHIQTSDETILPNGTGYITDIGMSGPKDSVLGIKKEVIIEKFLTQLPQSHKVASGDSIFNAVIIELDKKTKKTINIKRINEVVRSCQP